MKLLDAPEMPSWVVIQLLEKCNLRCRMCYEWGETGAYHALAKTATLDLEVVLRTVRECLPAKPTFEFFGGEPMLYPHLWQVIDLIRSGGCELAFPTNGTLIERHAERLVRSPPTRLWVSIDGPADINDAQRGAGVFRRVMRGLAKLDKARKAQGSEYPKLGVTCVVTPDNHRHIADFFLDGIDLSMLECVSIEMQSYLTRAQVDAYAIFLQREFGIEATPDAASYLRDPASFAGIDIDMLVMQMQRVARECASRGILFHSQPRTLTGANLQSYLSADWARMADRRSRCGVPWVSAEISARGDVTTCHTFYDLPLGNIHQQSLSEIWKGERIRKLRGHLREGLMPICTACCRYYGGAGALPAPRA
jgi:radical SAM protein with 4Fe4S-binding SPASM domain